MALATMFFRTSVAPPQIVVLRRSTFRREIVEAANLQSVDPGASKHCLHVRCNLDEVLVRQGNRWRVDKVLRDQVQLCGCIGLLLEQDSDRRGLGDRSQLE